MVNRSSTGRLCLHKKRKVPIDKQTNPTNPTPAPSNAPPALSQGQPLQTSQNQPNNTQNTTTYMQDPAILFQYQNNLSTVQMPNHPQTISGQRMSQIHQQYQPQLQQFQQNGFAIQQEAPQNNQNSSPLLH